ncbi:HAMP domain-containing sensor histidine kinase [soil metagenome]
MTESARTRTGVRWSVRSRILASILLVTAIGMGVAGVTSYLFQREQTLVEIDERLTLHVDSARQTIAGSATVETDPGTVSAPPTRGRPFADADQAVQSVLTHVPALRNESSLGIIEGEAKWIPRLPRAFAIEDDPALVRRIVSETASNRVVEGTSLTRRGWFRYVAVPITARPNEPVEGIYVAAIDIDAELADRSSFFLTYVFVSLGVLVAVGLVGWFVAGRLMRPIRSLRLAASRITASELRERIPVVGRDDVSELTETVNDMLDRIDGAMTSQRQLLDDVRHELKTPITIVRGHFEVLDVTNPAEVEAARALAIDELDRMAMLVDDIESLAQTSVAILAVPTDVADFTSDVYAKASVIPGHDWVLADRANARIAIDPGRITQAWLQLADNAAKYSAEGTTIELGSTVRRGGVEFWVADQGPGIAPQSVDRIFERFGRVDTGRGIRGSGLGLPIVKAIAQAHGGTVSLASSPAGSRFGIVVPTTDTTDTEELERIES